VTSKVVGDDDGTSNSFHYLGPNFFYIFATLGKHKKTMKKKDANKVSMPPPPLSPLLHH